MYGLKDKKTGCSCDRLKLYTSSKKHAQLNKKSLEVSPRKGNRRVPVIAINVRSYGPEMQKRCKYIHRCVCRELYYFRH